MSGTQDLETGIYVFSCSSIMDRKRHGSVRQRADIPIIQLLFFLHSTSSSHSQLPDILFDLILKWGFPRSSARKPSTKWFCGVLATIPYKFMNTARMLNQDNIAIITSNCMSSRKQTSNYQYSMILYVLIYNWYTHRTCIWLILHINNIE